MIDKPIKLAKCVRCGQYVFLAVDAGVRVVADMTPVDDPVAALVAGRALYDRKLLGGRPVALRRRTARSEPPTGPVLADHPCKTDATPVDVTPPAPKARARSSGPNLEDLADMKPIPVRRATRPLSKCENCGDMVYSNACDYVAIEYDGKWLYMAHDWKCT